MSTNFFKHIFILIGLLSIFLNLSAQGTLIKGKIIDGQTREPLAFTSIYGGINEDKLLINADFDGFFEVIVPDFFDTLVFSFTEYDKLIIATDSFKGWKEISLNRSEIKLKGIQITLKFNPALRLIKLAQDNKEKLSPANIEQYSCETNAKNIISVNNISKNIKKTKFGKELGNFFDTISYTSNDGSKSILPVFVSEVLSDFYFNKSPYLTKEVIKATRVKGVGVEDGSFISQVLGSTFTSYNFYNNTIKILDKGIPSPIGDLALSLYNFKLVNVERGGSRNIFHIKCTPKVEKDLAFNGYIWIEDTTGALLKLSLELNGNSNLNFIEKVRITQEYNLAGTHFINTKSRIIVDAKETSTNAMGIVASNTITYKNINISPNLNTKFFAERVKMADGALTKTDAYWDANRHTKSNSQDKRIEDKIDTLINLPAVKTYVDLANFIIDGHVNIDKIGIGPYYNLVSFNQMEGVRFRLGFKTNPSFSRNWQIIGMAAYGLKDKRIKYSGLVERILNRKRWTKIAVAHKKDVEQIGLTDVQMSGGGLFTAFNLLGSNTLNLNTESVVRFGTDLRTGLRLTLTASNRLYKFEETGNFNFAWYKNFPDTTNPSQQFTTSTVSLNLVYAPRNFFLQNDNKRVTFVSEGPQYYLTYQLGIKGILNSSFNFQKLNLGFSYNRVWGVIGRTNFNIEGNAVFGLVPYPLQTVYVGNQSFIYNQSAYNNMDIFEFVSDKSISSSVEHHFSGFFFNRIPLIKRLKWREIIGGKIIYGTLDKLNYDIIPKNYGSVKNINSFKGLDNLPYIEASVGIENIFKIIRVDAIWRLTYRNVNDYRRFGVKVSVGFGF